MHSQIRRDKKRRFLVQKYEMIRRVLKSLISNSRTSHEDRMAYMYRLHNLPRNSSVVRIRNRCLLTGRGRSVYRQFGISRISFRELAGNGFLPGVFKSSW